MRGIAGRGRRLGQLLASAFVVIASLTVASCGAFSSDAANPDGPGSPGLRVAEAATSGWFFQNNDPSAAGVLDEWARNISDYNSALEPGSPGRIERVYVWGGSLADPTLGRECPGGLPLCLQYFDASAPVISLLRGLLPLGVEIYSIIDSVSAADTAAINALAGDQSDAVVEDLAGVVCAAAVDGVVFDIEPLSLDGGQFAIYSEAQGALAARKCGNGSEPGVGVFGGPGTVAASADAAAQVVSNNPNTYFELSMFDLGDDGDSSRYGAAVGSVLDGSLPQLIDAGVAFSLALPAAASDTESECDQPVTATNPPPYYDIEKCVAEIDGKNHSRQSAYIHAFLGQIYSRAAAIVGAPGFRGYSLYQWAYPLSQTHDFPLPNVPPPYNGDPTEDVGACLREGLPYPGSAVPPAPPAACGP